MFNSKVMRFRSQLMFAHQRAFSKHLKAFATLDPKNLSASNKGMNLVNGEWKGTESYITLPDPMTGKDMI